jgi:hypothetical protein
VRYSRCSSAVWTGINLNDADFVLGIDFLGSQRVWISYGSQQLFLMRRI